MEQEINQPCYSVFIFHKSMGRMFNLCFFSLTNNTKKKWEKIKKKSKGLVVIFEKNFLFFKIKKYVWQPKIIFCFIYIRFVVAVEFIYLF